MGVESNHRFRLDAENYLLGILGVPEELTRFAVCGVGIGTLLIHILNSNTTRQSSLTCFIPFYDLLMFSQF